MSSHPAILSVRDAIHDALDGAGVGIPEPALPDNATNPDGAYDQEFKHQVASITNLYHAAVKIARDNAGSQKEIQDLKVKIRELEERAAKAQASIDNAPTVFHNSQRRCPYLYLPLKKTISDSGIDNAKEVCPDDIARDALVSETASIGTLPQRFTRQISEYSGMEILKMIIFYNDNFKIVHGDDLPARIDKFRSYLSEFAEIAEE